MKKPFPCYLAAATLLCICSMRTESQTIFSTFDDFLNQHTSAIFPTEKDSLFSLFWRQALKQGIPFVDSNRNDVTFLYRGSADSVKVYGDFTSWTFKLKMRKLLETDLFYLKLSFEQDARLDYKLIVNNQEMLDPLNKGIGPGGYGDHSELTMPDFNRSLELKELDKTPKGTLTTLSHSSKVLGYGHKVFVYLPVGYDTGRAQYPVVYFQDGPDYVNFAKTPTILDNMIASKVIPPVIGVFVAPPTESTRNRATEYSLNDTYVKFFSTELIPFIDKKYRTNQTSTARYAVGASFGGLISLYLAFTNPNQISTAASQSGYVSFNNDTLLTMFKQSPAKPIRVYADVGTYEKNVGGFPPGTTEGNFYRANRSFRKILGQKEYAFEYRDFHDGHSWGRWRNELPYILRWFFAPAKQK